MPSVLVVQSDPPLFPSLQWSLAEEGIDVALVSEQFDFAEWRTGPSVVVLNTFADPSGRPELVARIRWRLPGVPIIELRQAWETPNPSPAESCLTEPFSMDDLASEIDRLTSSGDTP